MPGRHVVVLLAAALLLAGCTAPSPSRLRVASWNIRHAEGMDGIVDIERTAAVLATLDADVVLLQEVDDRCGRSRGIDQADALARRLGMTAAFTPFMDHDGGRYGLAILARGDLAAAHPIPLPPGRLEPRAALAVELELADGTRVRVVNAHLDWLEDDASRRAQAAALLAAVDALDADRPLPLVLGGDLNDEPDSPTVRTFLDPGPDAGFLRVAPAGRPATFPADDPRREIDHLLVRPRDRWATFGLAVIDETTASDHRPIVADLEIHAGDAPRRSARAASPTGRPRSSSRHRVTTIARGS